MSSVEGETVLKLRGELDIWTQQLFVDALTDVDESVARIVLDLSDLTFIDCGNIGLIHQSRIVAGLRGTFLELRSPHPQLSRIMELTGLLPSVGGEQLGPIVPSPPARTSTQRSGETNAMADLAAFAGHRGGVTEGSMAEARN